MRWRSVLSPMVAVAALATATPLPAQAALPAAQRAAIDALFAPWDRLHSPGCTAAASRHGELLFEGAWGMANLELGVPLRPDSVFYAGSVSKQFTAAAVALLAEREQLDLDADVRGLLPWLRIEQPFTSRQLLHHTGGVRDYFELLAMTGASDRAFIDGNVVRDLLSRQRDLNFVAGSAYSYSNGGYWLLSELVREASGQSLAQFTQREFFDPIGMRRSHFEDDHRRIVRDRVSSYGTGEDGELFRYVKAFDAVGSGGVMTTAADLLLWAHEFDAPRVLSPALVERMQDRGQLLDGTTIPYALGLQHGTYRGAATVGHGGALLGFRTQLTRVPEHGVVVAVLCNLPATQPGALAEGILDVLLGDVLQAPLAATPPPAPDAAAPLAPPDDLATFAGIYRSDELEVEYALAVVDGALRLRIRDRDRGALVWRGDDAFGGPTGTLQFQRDAHGAIAGFALGSGRAHGVAFRRAGE